MLTPVEQRESIGRVLRLVTLGSTTWVVVQAGASVRTGGTPAAGLHRRYVPDGVDPLSRVSGPGNLPRNDHLATTGGTFRQGSGSPLPLSPQQFFCVHTPAVFPDAGVNVFPLVPVVLAP